MNDIKREAIRVAVAFGVQQWSECLESYWECYYRGYKEPGVWVQIEFEDNVAEVRRFVVGEYDHEWGSFRTRCQVWATEAIPASMAHYNEVMMRGLYCLGFENEEVLDQLNSPLTMHEQLELRGALPHEHWPAKWRD
ncbi:hypothetical protein EON83_01900 [bacterium]|nr:MAG: hypothetical protein EON83_01900 [bacterium]